MYCVVTADVNRSRSIRKREILQQKIIGTIDEVNRQFASFIAVPFSITLGDEWQGLLQSPAKSYEIVAAFRENLTDVSISFGVGVGEISTSLQDRTSSMDGQAFHRSRIALNLAKKKKREVMFSTGDERLDGLLNAVCALLQTIHQRWTDRQREKILLYKKHQNETKVAQVLGVTQGDIHQALKAGAGKIYIECENELNAFLASMK